MLKRIGLMVGLAASFLGLAGTAGYASTPTSGSGTFDITITLGAPTRLADGNVFIPFGFDETITGLFSGIRVGEGSLILHPDGTFNARDSGTFTGTAAGSAPGTAIGSAVASGSFASFAGHFVATDGAGGLAGAHGEAAFNGALISPPGSNPVEFAGTYSGQNEFGAS